MLRSEVMVCTGVEIMPYVLCTRYVQINISVAEPLFFVYFP